MMPRFFGLRRRADAPVKYPAIEDGCPWCGEKHGARCPWIKAIEYDATTGVPTRVEYLTPVDMFRQQSAEPPTPTYPRKPAMKGS